MTELFLAQGRGEMAVLPAVTAVLLHQSALDTWNDCIFLTQGRGKMAVLPKVIAVLLHESAIDT